MKSYAETRNKTVVDWKEIVIQCKTNKSTINEILSKYRELVGSWSTCPCGQLSDSVARQHDGEPDDSVLAAAGFAFTKSFIAGKWDNCLNLLEIISIRADYLLAEKRSEIVSEINRLETMLKSIPIKNQ